MTFLTEYLKISNTTVVNLTEPGTQKQTKQQQQQQQNQQTARNSGGG